MDDDKGPKYEKEIRALLDDMPEFLPDEKTPLPFRKVRPSRQFTPPARTPRFVISAKSVAILAFVCLGISYVIRPAAHQIAQYFGVATVALIVLALGLAVAEGRRTSYERRWRGRVITLPSDTPGWQRSLGQWWWRVRGNFRRRRRR